MNGVRTLADISMFDFGVEVEATIDDTDVDMDNAEFLNGTRLKGGAEFDNAINLWTRHMPDWKAICPKDLSNKTSIVVTDLEKVDLKVLMEDIGENHHCGLLPFMIKSSRGQLGVLTLKAIQNTSTLCHKHLWMKVIAAWDVMCLTSL